MISSFSDAEIQYFLASFDVLGTGVPNDCPQPVWLGLFFCACIGCAIGGCSGGLRGGGVHCVRSGCGIEIVLHGGGAGGITAVDGVGIEAVCHFGRRMTETVRDGDGIHVVGEEQRGMAMPLRYNNDKQKKPLFSRGLSVCRLLFNSFSKLKIDENYKEKRRLFY